ncbi:MAG: PIN domain-containing protein [Candidatus Caldarchaeum sp.]|nr:PIN domain-containing protein [Candidatus Caldarchaeum sp.]
MKLLPDTNVLVYDTFEDSSRHHEAVKIIDDAQEMTIPAIIIHEFIWVMLKYSVQPSTITAKIREYLEDPRTRYMDEPVDALADALKMLEEDKAELKNVNDYIILSLAKRFNVVLATFDTELKKIAATKGVAVVP